MFDLKTGVVIAALMMSSVAYAQDDPIQDEIDCEDEANAEDEACTGLPLPNGGAPITNFAPIVGPIAGVLGVAGLLGGGGGDGTTSTTTTTSTTSTTN